MGFLNDGGERLLGGATRLEAFAACAECQPARRVLTPSNPQARGYGRNPYVGYDTAPRPFLFDGRYDGPASPLMRLVASDGGDRAFSLDLMRQKKEITQRAYVVRWRPGRNWALDAAEIARGRDVGTVTVQRRLEGGRLEDAVYDVVFGFAFRAFRPDRPIVHTE